MFQSSFEESPYEKKIAALDGKVECFY